MVILKLPAWLQDDIGTPTKTYFNILR